MKIAKKSGELSMPEYKFILKKKAKKFIDKLPQNEKFRIITAIEKLPDSGDIKTVKGHQGMYRLRVGDYRILYTVESGRYVVLVIDIGNRGQIYNQY